VADSYYKEQIPTVVMFASNCPEDSLVSAIIQETAILVGDVAGLAVCAMLKRLGNCRNVRNALPLSLTAFCTLIFGTYEIGLDSECASRTCEHVGVKIEPWC
jgi:hypothetical protein